MDRRYAREIDGYLVPVSIPIEAAKHIAVGEDGNVVLERFVFPMQWLSVSQAPGELNILPWRWVANILGDNVGLSRIEFPILDAMVYDPEREPALVTVYRAKVCAE